MFCMLVEGPVISQFTDAYRNITRMAERGGRKTDTVPQEYIFYGVVEHAHKHLTLLAKGRER